MRDGLLLHGDCLDRVGELGADADPFELVYLDPPFATGVHRGARRGKGERATGELAYRDRWPSVAAFIAFLEPRLAALRSMLTDAGSLWLHLDYRAVHDAKVACDRVFGTRAFRGEVIWVPGNGGRRRSAPSVTHQTILVYAAGKKMLWNDGDPSLREPYADTSLRMHFGNVDEHGRRYRDRTIAGKTYRYYADEGRRIGSVWSDCPAMSANTPLTKETTGYPTQKPEKLLRRIVRAASSAGGRVLDPMCGSGTTLVAAAREGRRWAGIDRSPVAIETTERRLAQL